MLLLDMMRNKKREENERKKVRPGIRDKRLQSTPIMRLWPMRANTEKNWYKEILSGGANPRDGAGAEKEEGG